MAAVYLEELRHRRSAVRRSVCAWRYALLTDSPWLTTDAQNAEENVTDDDSIQFIPDLDM